MHAQSLAPCSQGCRCRGIQNPDWHDPPSCETPSSVRAPNTSGTDETHGPRVTPRHPTTRDHGATPDQGRKGAAGGRVKAHSRWWTSSLPPATLHTTRGSPDPLWRDCCDKWTDATADVGHQHCTGHPAEMHNVRVIKPAGAPPVSSRAAAGLRGLRHLCTSGRSSASCRVVGSPHPPLIHPHARPAHTPMQVGGCLILECAVHDSGNHLTRRDKEPAQFRLALHHCTHGSVSPTCSFFGYITFIRMSPRLFRLAVATVIG